MAIKFYGGHQLNSKAKVYGTRQDFETIEVDENGDPITEASEASSYFLTRSNTGMPRTLYLRSTDDLDATPTTLVNTASGFGVNHNMAVHPSGQYVAVADTYEGGDGVVFVYDTQDLSAPLATLSPDSGEATYNQNYAFGYSMTMSDTKLFIGNNASGVPVYCYDLSDLSAAPSKIPTPATYHGGGNKFSSDMAANSTHLFIGHSSCRNPLTSNDNQTEAGAVHVYDVETLQYQTTLYGFNPEYDDYFGSEVKATDTHLAVGAYGDDEASGTQNKNGAVYVFDAADLSATPTKVMPLTSGHSDEFGRVISLSDTHLAVGEPYDNTNSNESGALHIYDLTDLSNPTISYGTLYAEYYGSNPLLFNDGSNKVSFYRSFANLGQPAKYFVYNIDDLNTPLWESQTEMPYAFLPAYTPASPVRYYKTLATQYVPPPLISSTSPVAEGTWTVVTSAQFGNDFSGQAFIMREGGNNTTLSTPAEGSMVGSAVASGPNEVFVGNLHHGAQNTGRIFVFDKTTGSLIRTLFGPNQYETNFGSEELCVSSDGSRLATRYLEYVYVQGSTTERYGLGHVRILDADGSNVIDIQNPDYQLGNAYANMTGFGSQMGFTSTKLIIGANGADTNGENSGSVFILDPTNGNVITRMDGSAGERFGFAIDTQENHSRFLVGSSGYNGVGRVQLFEEDGTEIMSIERPTAGGAGEFGRNVAYGSGRIVVTELLDTSVGRVFIFNEEDGSLINEITGPRSDNWGTGDIEVAGNYIFVSASGVNSNNGAFWVYDLDGNNGTRIDNIGTSGFAYFGSKIHATVG